jgi:hypothetical protein
MVITPRVELSEGDLHRRKTSPKPQKEQRKKEKSLEPVRPTNYPGESSFGEISSQKKNPQGQEGN